MVWESFSEEETRALGVWLGKLLPPGSVLGLDGDLGCGKTLLSGGIGEGLGIKEPVTSPTFTILQVYEDGRLPLYHYDVYRIGDPDEMDEIGFEDYVYGEGITVVEWCSLIRERMPEKTVYFTIVRDGEKGDCYRRITITLPEKEREEWETLLTKTLYPAWKTGRKEASC